ncbi:MAG: DUF2971 domain-containing protein [Rhodospirillales bacterium]|nr:DUF2971 domain-containing protein [Rhodospirillales bacterium]
MATEPLDGNAMLSHYTNIRGLLGIVRSQSLWATDSLVLNDRTEFFFALSAIYESSIQIALPKVPSDIRDESKDRKYFSALLPDIITGIQKQAAESDGYGNIYITSFARGRTEDENERGILSLWREYTGNEGYCLQFEEAHVRECVRSESEKHSYAWLEIADVKYGIDREDRDFKYLAEQFSCLMLLRLFEETRDRRLAQEVENRDVESIFIQKFISYCGKHKDPAFSDEREVRIFACPINVTTAVVFSGRVQPKKIHKRESEHGVARYIAIGETFTPGFIPKRILSGPNTSTPIWIRGLYPPAPSIKACGISHR